MGVEFLMTLEKSTSTVEKLASTSKKTMNIIVESTLMSARTIVPPMSFNFKRRLAKKLPIFRKELTSVPNNSNEFYREIVD